MKTKKNNTLRITTKSEVETIALGERLARFLKSGDIVCLQGDLGSGKTTFVKGLVKGRKLNPAQVHSPTFVLMNIYKGRVPIYHFDFYRLEDVREIDLIGYDDFMYGKGITVVEWSDRLQHLTPPEYLQISFKYQGPQKRTIHISAVGRRYNDYLRNWRRYSAAKRSRR